MSFRFTRRVRSLGRLRCERGPDMLPCGRQLLEMLVGAARGGFSPLEYRLYRFGRRGLDRSGYAPLGWIEREFRARLNPPEAARVLKDKLRFFGFCRRRGLPTARVLALVGGGEVPDGIESPGDADALASFLARLPPGLLVAKPRGSVGGKGVMVIERRPDGSLLDAAGQRATTPAELWKRMASDIERRQLREDALPGYLLQEYVRSDPALNPSGGTALNTLRIATLLDSSGAARLDFAMLRLARPGASSDNLHQGGTVLRVELETGAICAPAWGYRTPGGPWLAPRPVDPLALFPGGRVPGWEGLSALARDCALALPETRSVGWDITLGNRGPTVIEGNDNWDMVIAQVMEGPYLTAARQALLAELGLRLPRAPGAAG